VGQRRGKRGRRGLAEGRAKGKTEGDVVGSRGAGKEGRWRIPKGTVRGVRAKKKPPHRTIPQRFRRRKGKV